ncbi:hypothetical protein PR202_gb05617 [Eleusine coracana subsp. coracana]|uniref:F-box domain-containing protein n=1 Tax=Eleusine coracana subsp. coracana TaxID=191504 RepID=A0AAV5E6U8_ELECO|nr:hypothetical protein QOZ80_1BG0074090 [Eleusine coracana subsp. coracana]GJN18453.1 hypothetical protein PR202_gb05617 [Eleusine coracana subsp. coracana]
MEDNNPPTQSPPRKHRKASIPTTIYSLSEDLILTIFLYLPSLATLIRAALTCREWRHAVASSPSFRRLFCELHPAPLLGLFFNAPTVVENPDFPAFPNFVPVRHRDRDLAAVLRGSDFFLTSIQEHPDKFHCWGITDCRRGYILLHNGDMEASRPMALLNPLVRRGERFFDDGHENAYEGYVGCPMERDTCLLFSDDNPMVYKVVRLIYDASRVRATVYSSHNNKWSIGPWVDVSMQPQSSRMWILNSNMQVNGFLYWVSRNFKYLVTLDTATMKFSVEELPEFLKNQHCSFKVGEMSRDTPCIFYATGFKVGILLRKIDNDGVERWLRVWRKCLKTQLFEVFRVVLLNYNELQVVAVEGGFVYLALSKKFHEVQIPSWFFTLCLKTGKMEKLFQRSYDSVVYPYVLAWPPSLVGNFGRFARGDDA